MEACSNCGSKDVIQEPSVGIFCASCGVVLQGDTFAVSQEEARPPDPTGHTRVRFQQSSADVFHRVKQRAYETIVRFTAKYSLPSYVPAQVLGVISHILEEGPPRQWTWRHISGVAIHSVCRSNDFPVSLKEIADMVEAEPVRLLRYYRVVCDTDDALRASWGAVQDPKRLVERVCSTMQTQGVEVVSLAGQLLSLAGAAGMQEGRLKMPLAAAAVVLAAECCGVQPFHDPKSREQVCQKLSITVCSLRMRIKELTTLLIKLSPCMPWYASDAPPLASAEVVRDLRNILNFWRRQTTAEGQEEGFFIQLEPPSYTVAAADIARRKAKLAAAKERLSGVLACTRPQSLASGGQSLLRTLLQSGATDRIEALSPMQQPPASPDAVAVGPQDDVHLPSETDLHEPTERERGGERLRQHGEVIATCTSNYADDTTASPSPTAVSAPASLTSVPFPFSPTIASAPSTINPLSTATTTSTAAAAENAAAGVATLVSSQPRTPSGSQRPTSATANPLVGPSSSVRDPVSVPGLSVAQHPAADVTPSPLPATQSAGDVENVASASRSVSLAALLSQLSGNSSSEATGPQLPSLTQPTNPPVSPTLPPTSLTSVAPRSRSSRSRSRRGNRLVVRTRVSVNRSTDIPDSEDLIIEKLLLKHVPDDLILTKSYNSLLEGINQFDRKRRRLLGECTRRGQPSRDIYRDGGDLEFCVEESEIAPLSPSLSFFEGQMGGGGGSGGGSGGDGDAGQRTGEGQSRQAPSSSMLSSEIRHTNLEGGGVGGASGLSESMGVVGSSNDIDRTGSAREVVTVGDTFGVGVGAAGEASGSGRQAYELSPGVPVSTPIRIDESNEIDSLIEA
eukprot:Rmarinus@m.19768